MNPAAARAAVGFALGIPAALLIIGGRQLLPILGGVFLISAFVSARSGDRWVQPSWLRGAIQIALAAAVVLLVRPTMPPLRSGGFGLYVAVLFGALAMSRPYFVNDRLAQTTTLGLGLLSLMGLARVTAKPAFGIAVAAFLGAAVIATLARDRSAPLVLRHRRGVLAPLLLAFTIAGAVMAGFGVGLPAAEPAVSRALNDYLDAPDQGQSGFGDGRIELGSISEIVSSDEVVMRIYGAPVDHLRGQVYVDYEVGRWAQRARSDGAVPRAARGVLPLGTQPRAEAVRVEATHDVGRAYFAPLEAAQVEGVPDDARRDAYGVAIPPVRVLNDDRAWQVQLGHPEGRALAPPNDGDRVVPRWLRADIQDLSRAWVGDAESPQARVDALIRGLGRLEYSLKLDPVPKGVDPVLHFLNTARRGHCEYFASAFVLLVRAAGVPARLVTGYRVFEYNPVGAYFVVRKRDAHAWAEVWVDGRWQTADPTPPGALDGEQTPVSSWWGARWDLVRRWVGQAFERLANLSQAELAAALAGAALLAVVWLGLRRRAPKGPRRAVRQHAALIRLEAHLTRAAALPRPPSESLQAYAERVRAAGRSRGAALIEACAAQLYGGDEPEDLDARVEAYLAERDAG